MAVAEQGIAKAHDPVVYEPNHQGIGTTPDLYPRCRDGVVYPDAQLIGTHADAVTEPWLANLLCALLVAQGGSTVLETGGFMGVTSAWLYTTLERMGGGKLIVAEINNARAADIATFLRKFPCPNTEFVVENKNVLDVIRELPDQSLDVAWVDDDHTPWHVGQEIGLLWPKMRKGGLLVFHDVWGPLGLDAVIRRFGGYPMAFPRLGPAGGLGVVQIPL